MTARKYGNGAKVFGPVECVEGGGKCYVACRSNTHNGFVRIAGRCTRRVKFAEAVKFAKGE